MWTRFMNFAAQHDEPNVLQHYLIPTITLRWPSSRVVRVSIVSVDTRLPSQLDQELADVRKLLDYQTTLRANGLG